MALAEVLIGGDNRHFAASSHAKHFLEAINGDVACLVKQEKRRHGLLGHLVPPQHGHSDPEERRKKRRIPVGVTFRYDDIDAGTAAAEHVEINLGAAD